MPVSSIDEQRKIVAEYQAIERRIENNRRLIATIEETAQAIYRKMFVDDIDVENLPEGWRMGTIGEFCKETKSGGTPNRSNPKYWDKHHYRWLKSGEVANNIIFDTEEYISREGLKGSSAKIIPSGTVVMAMYGATASQVTYLDCDTTTNQACCNMLTVTFEEAAYLYFHCLYQQENIKRLANGGAQENLSQELICAQPILICENTHIYDVFSKLLSAKIAFSKENYCCGILLKNLLSNIVII
ncbi:restriction endonuclease subunit S [Parabacteroides distasonis]|uniref:restriction endonuclease subunit S n=1 Tax=Parabacteroides distasonis TaxID=823 RepID=UPI002166954D|nr:restriction endonuclease subunit S [Parabacteroides distasonis]MCS2605519.1 restriction endonuclease subunit S [Parabacteroides distasonis]